MKGDGRSSTSKRNEIKKSSENVTGPGSDRLFWHEVKTTGFHSIQLVLTHPIDYARTLIQLGYEPFNPVERRGFLFKTTYLALPNIFEYIRYIKNVDGFLGCYKGLGARLCQKFVADTVYRKVSAKNPWIGTDERPEDSEQQLPQQYPLSGARRSVAAIRDVLGDMNQDFVVALKKTGWDIVCVTASATASHPFYVVAVRTMAQFVGRESCYKSLLQSIKYIYDNEGIAGFFSGLIPRVVGDILYVSISASLVYLASIYLGKQNGLDSISALMSNLAATSVTYQYHVVSSVMAVNNSGLAIGAYPFAVKYDGWYECWKDLAEKRQLKRGSAIIGRCFAGQIVIINGAKRPTGFYFGPLHPPGLGSRDALLNNAFLMTRPKTEF